VFKKKTNPISRNGAAAKTVQELWEMLWAYEQVHCMQRKVWIEMVPSCQFVFVLPMMH